MFDMWGDNAPVDPDDFDDAAELDRAVAAARDAEVAVVVVGEWQNMIGEAASRSSLELPGGAARACCRRSSRPARRSCCW